MIKEAGLYLSIPMTKYLGDPCPEPSLSCSIAQLMLERSPAHARAVHPRLREAPAEPEEFKFNLGTALHQYLLGDLLEFTVIEADTYRSAKAQILRDAALTRGWYPILGHQFERVRKIATCVKHQIDCHPELNGIVDDAKNIEVTCAWQEQDYGNVWCRCRPDIQHPDMLVDLKFTAIPATPQVWGSSHAFKMGYHRRAAFYQRGWHAATGDRIQYLFVVVETEEPYQIAHFECSPDALDMGQQDVAAALTMWQQGMMQERWPGYPQRVQWINPPSWAMALGQ